MCLAPNDKDARLKMNECEKLIRKIEFLKAIEQSDPPSAAEGLDLESMGVLEPPPLPSPEKETPKPYFEGF